MSKATNEIEIKIRSEDEHQEQTFFEWIKWCICNELWPCLSMKVTMDQEFKKRQKSLAVIIITIIMELYGFVFLIVALNGNITKENEADYLPLMGLLSKKGLKNGYYWTVITYTFVHLHPLHFLCNIVMFNIIGKEFNQIIGNFCFVFIFLTCSVIGGAVNLHGLDEKETNCGASAGISGIQGALIVFMIIHWKRFSQGKKFMIIWLFNGGLSEIIGTILGSKMIIMGNTVAHDSHAAAFIFGVCMMISFMRSYWNKDLLNKENIHWSIQMCSVLVILAIVAFIIIKTVICL